MPVFPYMFTRLEIKIFKNKLQTIDESFMDSLAKGLIAGPIGGGSTLHLLTDLSLEKIIYLGGAISAYILKSAIDDFLAKRALKRECSISYILSLDK